MLDLLLYLTCGLSAGIVGGYLGLGGGIIMVPFMTLLMGVDIKTAVPVSMSAVMVNSISCSNEYLKKNMVDIELGLVLAVFTVLGNIAGSNLDSVIPGNYIRLLFAAVLLFSAFFFIRPKKQDPENPPRAGRAAYIFVSVFVTFLTGFIAALVGSGGGLIIVPILFMVLNLPLTVVRGTWSFTFGFAAAASTAVYFINGQMDLELVPPVIVGILIGGKIGGSLGTRAKPMVIKIAFFILLLYTAFEMTYKTLKGM
jgi:uncharacterized membrane protein YfcA